MAQQPRNESTDKDDLGSADFSRQDSSNQSKQMSLGDAEFSQPSDSRVSSEDLIECFPGAKVTASAQIKSHEEAKTATMHSNEESKEKVTVRDVVH